MTMHEGLTISSSDQLYDLMKSGAGFRNYNFDDAELADFDAEEMSLESCSLKRVDFLNLTCVGIRIADSDLERACFDNTDIKDEQATTTMPVRNTWESVARG